jgi:hypothetical protein
MRISLELAMQGGHSDCRNRNIQKMFQLIGYGDQAGSGIPKILRNWMTNQHRRPPLWEERLEPDQTLLTLPLASLIPEDTLKHLNKRYGNKFNRLPDLHRLALATVDIEGRVSHNRLASMTTAHRTDVTEVLRSLVKKGFLSPIGAGRGTYYVFPGDEENSETYFLDGLFSPFQTEQIQAEENIATEIGSVISDQSAGKEVEVNSEHLVENSEHLVENSEHYEELLKIAGPVRDKGRVDKSIVIDVLMHLCSGRYLELRTLAKLLDRSSDSLRNHYINPLIKEGRLEPRFPERPNHPNQAYRAKQVDQ